MIKLRAIAARKKRTKHFKPMIAVRCTKCPYPDLPACMAHTGSSLQRKFSHLFWALDLCTSAICSLRLPRSLSSTRSSFPTHSSYHAALLNFFFFIRFSPFIKQKHINIDNKVSRFKQLRCISFFFFSYFQKEY